MKNVMLFWGFSIIFSFAIFANSSGENIRNSYSLILNQPIAQFNHSSSASNEIETTSPSESSSVGRVFGIGFLFFISLIFAITLLILSLFIFFRWKKLEFFPKLLISGCSIISLLFFILSLIGASLSLYYFVKDKNSSREKSYQHKQENPADILQEDSEKSFAAEDREIDEEKMLKFAFSKFNNALKFYQEYQKNHDPEIYKKAIEEIEYAITIDPENPVYWLLAGKMYSEISPDYDVQVLAEFYLRKSLELDPKNLQTLLSLANCLSLQERYYEANEIFTKVLSKNYYAFRDYLVPIITYTYIYDQQYEKAEKFLRKLLENDPGSDVLRISLAITLNIQGKDRAEEAKNELRKIIAKSDSPQILKTYASNLINNFDKWHDKRYQGQ